MKDDLRMCVADECAREIRARGMCDKHYRRWKHHGHTELLPKVKKLKPPCVVEGCDREFYGKGYCFLHWARLRRTGTTEPPADTTREEYEARFWTKVDRGNDCWMWLAGRNKFGYGKFFAGRHVLAHRFAYELSVKPIPDGLTLDHLCFNRACVNPAHLEPVTHAENARRMWEKRKEDEK